MLSDPQAAAHTVYLQGYLQDISMWHSRYSLATALAELSCNIYHEWVSIYSLLPQ